MHCLTRYQTRTAGHICGCKRPGTSPCSASQARVNEAEELVYALFDNLAEVVGEILNYTPVKLKTEAQIHAVADTLREVGPKTLSEKLDE